MGKHRRYEGKSGIPRRDFLKLLGAGAASVGTGSLVGFTPVAYPADPITINWVVWSYSVETILDNIRKFEAEYQNRIKVNLTDFSWNAYHETIVNRLHSRTPTDILYNGGNWLPEMVRAGWVVPLDDYFPAVTKYKEKIVGYALEDMTYQGKLYGLPYYADITSFQYNEKLLKDYGINRPPETWEEVTDQSKFLQKKGMEFPVVLELAQSLPTTHDNFSAMVFGRGEDLVDEHDEPLFAHPKSAAWQQLQWLAKARNTDKIMTYLPHETDVQKAMNTGRHVFTVLYNYNLAALNNKAVSPLAGQFKIGLMPGQAHATFGFCRFYCMTKMATERGPAVLDALWKFLEYFGGEYKGEYVVAKRWAVEKGLGFGQLPLWDDPEVVDTFARWIDVDMLKRQQALARKRHETVWYGIWGEFFRIQLMRAVAGEASVEEALEAAANKWNQLKKQFS
ncbi:MAG: extracellular solute-binding protein [Nitrospinota bacterium]|nr:MAG: extracellular solute-binding protein [Nitrospinota bacterium]